MYNLNIFTFCIIVIIVFYVFCNDQEHLTNISNESLQNLGGMYNTSQLTTTNITSTGDATVSGKLTVAGKLTVGGDSTFGNSTFGGSTSSILLNNGHTGFSDNKTYGFGSEISNDIKDYKTLMIVGNNSAGSSRKVGIWDDLTVGGSLTAGNLIVGGRNILAELDEIKRAYVR